MGFDSRKGEENISLVTDNLIESMISLSEALGTTEQYHEMLNEYKSRNKLPPSSKFIKQVNEQEGLFKILNLSKPLDHIIEDNVYKKFVNEVESSNIKHNELSNINEIGF
ncbi:MAG: hypothetical protein CM15mP22_5220 [Gammaproteobacteria bacterium]|nr:MAG: hypothetical protein CM15mP22_5220 [Gammaproteobacteria bacterium]